MITDHLIDLDNYELITNIGYSGQYYMIKEKSTGELYCAKIILALENYFIHFYHTNKYEEQCIHISSRANATTTLNHPAIIKFVGYSPKSFEENPFPMIITELAIKGSLHDTIKSFKNKPKNDQWNDTKKLICMYGIASAISYLHSKNLLYFNLDTSNIYLDDDYFPKISLLSMLTIHDFYPTSDLNEISEKSDKFIDLFTKFDIQDEIKKIKLRSIDVKLFGYIIYEIITEIHPFDFIFGNLQDKYPEIPDDVPDAYRRLIEMCWSQNNENKLSFELIVLELRCNEGFITESVDLGQFDLYVQSVDTFLKSNEPKI